MSFSLVIIYHSLLEMCTVLGEDFLGPTPSSVTFQSSSTSNLDTQCTQFSIIDDGNYEGVHSFSAGIGALAEPHISINNNSAQISIQDDGKTALIFNIVHHVMVLF